MINTGSPPYPDQFSYLHIPIIDAISENIGQYFDKAIKFIETGLKEGNAVLVHCAAGVSRSATIVISYLMATRKLNVVEALKFVKERRPKVNPNTGFLKQLTDFEKKLREIGL